MVVIVQEIISDNALNVCRLMARGYSVQKACAEIAISTDTFYDEMRGNQELQKEYIRAREARSDVRFEQAENTLQACRNGEIPSDVARVLMDGIKWQTSKEKPKVYGDATILRGDKDNPIEIGLSSALESIATRRLPAIESQREVIDLVPLPVKAEDFI